MLEVGVRCDVASRVGGEGESAGCGFDEHNSAWASDEVDQATSSVVSEVAGAPCHADEGFVRSRCLLLRCCSPAGVCGSVPTTCAGGRRVRLRWRAIGRDADAGNRCRRCGRVVSRLLRARAAACEGKPKRDDGDQNRRLHACHLYVTSEGTGHLLVSRDVDYRGGVHSATCVPVASNAVTLSSLASPGATGLGIEAR